MDEKTLKFETDLMEIKALAHAADDRLCGIPVTVRDKKYEEGMILFAMLVDRIDELEVDGQEETT